MSLRLTTIRNIVQKGQYFRVHYTDSFTRQTTEIQIIREGNIPSCVQAKKHALKPTADVTRSPKQACQLVLPQKGLTIKKKFFKY